MAVDHLSFEVRPGEVTGFLGRNGAGKSTTMRMVVGLDAPTSGRVTVDGHAYRDLRFPRRHVGALLEARAIHPGRSAPDPPPLAGRFERHRPPAGRGSPRARRPRRGRPPPFGWVLPRHGPAPWHRHRVARRSRHSAPRRTRQRLDPEGIQWIRQLLRSLAAEGRPILVSSHLMSEMAQTADRLVVVGRGRLIAEGTVGPRAPQLDRLRPGRRRRT